MRSILALSLLTTLATFAWVHRQITAFERTAEAL